MNRCAVVLTACLVWPTPFAAAQSPFKNSALEISVRFDDETRVDQRIRTVDGASVRILVGASRPVQKRQYIPTPAFEVVPRVLGQSVHVQTSANAAEGRLGEWFKLGAVATTGGTRTVWIKV